MHATLCTDGVCFDLVGLCRLCWPQQLVVNLTKERSVQLEALDTVADVQCGEGKGPELL